MHKGYAVVGVKGKRPHRDNFRPCLKKLLFLFFCNPYMVSQEEDRVSDLICNCSDILAVLSQVEQGAPLKLREQETKVSPANPDAWSGTNILLGCILFKGFLDKRTAASLVWIEISQVKPFKPDDFSRVRFSKKQQNSRNGKGYPFFLRNQEDRLKKNRRLSLLYAL